MIRGSAAAATAFVSRKIARTFTRPALVLGGGKISSLYDWTILLGSLKNTILLGLGMDGPSILPDSEHLGFELEVNGYELSDTVIFIVYLLFLQITLITLFNILIAIVCDSYDDALSRSDKTFW